MIVDESSDVLVSAATAWEIATKYRLGKLPGGGVVTCDLSDPIGGQECEEMTISAADAERAGRLPGSHLDPFDRMLAVQALTRDPTGCSTMTVFIDGGGSNTGTVQEKRVTRSMKSAD